MIIIFGLILLIAAVVVGVAGVLSTRAADTRSDSSPCSDTLQRACHVAAA
jgi:hypothetical protein